LPPGVNSDFTPRMDAVPALGEQSDSILSVLGYGPEVILQLRQVGVI